MILLIWGLFLLDICIPFGRWRESYTSFIWFSSARWLLGKIIWALASDYWCTYLFTMRESAGNLMSSWSEWGISQFCMPDWSWSQASSSLKEKDWLSLTLGTSSLAGRTASFCLLLSLVWLSSNLIAFNSLTAFAGELTPLDYLLGRTWPSPDNLLSDMSCPLEENFISSLSAIFDGLASCGVAYNCRLNSCCTSLPLFDGIFCSWIIVWFCFSGITIFLLLALLLSPRTWREEYSPSSFSETFIMASFLRVSLRLCLKNLLFIYVLLCPRSCWELIGDCCDNSYYYYFCDPLLSPSSFFC